MDSKTPVEREAAARAKVAQRRREAQLVRDRENRQAFLRGYWAAMCRRNCWTYNNGTMEDVRMQVSPRRLSWRALVEMARTAESFRRAQYAHLDAVARGRSEGTGWPVSEAWRALGDALGVSRDLQTCAFLKFAQGPSGDTLQAAAFNLGRAGLYAIARHPEIILDSHYQDAYGEPRA